jgi:hypothetical protein
MKIQPWQRREYFTQLLERAVTVFGSARIQTDESGLFPVLGVYRGDDLVAWTQFGCVYRGDPTPGAGLVTGNEAVDPFARKVWPDVGGPFARVEDLIDCLYKTAESAPS